MAIMKQSVLMLMLTCFALLFWGWQTDVLWLAGLFGLMLCLAYIKGGQYDFEIHAFYQIAHLCALIVLAAFAFYWLDERASKAILPTVRLLPLALLPLLLIQYLYKQQLVPSSALLFFQRKSLAKPAWFDMSLLFIFICLFSAGAVVHQDFVYFTGTSVLLLVFLLIQHHHQQARYTLHLLGMFLLAEVMGMGLVYGMQDMQQRLEAKINAWILSYSDGNKGSTAIGEVGRLQLSDRVLFRVQSDTPLNVPMLLLEGTYQRYRGQTWFGGGWKDVTVPFEDDVWKLQEGALAERELVEGEHKGSHLTFYQSFDDDQHAFALPANSQMIAKLDVKNLMIRQGGRVEAQGLPPFAAYDVFYGGSNQLRLTDKKQRSDLDIPKYEQATIAQVASMLHLYEIKERQGVAKAIEVLQQYFLQQFTYTTWLNISQKPTQTPLSSFLLEDKQGHCEYFASATVLLLRELGIPTRYAVGYSVSEYDADAGVYLVRGRDAHAWAIAKVNDRWINIDNTPPNWLSIENENQSQFQGLWDWFSNVQFSFKKWRYGDSEVDKKWWYGLLVILFAYLAIRVLRRVKTRQYQDEKESRQGDEQWHKLEQALKAAGLERKTGETVRQWLKRIKGGKWQKLAQLYDVQHYAAQGMSAEQQQVYVHYVQEIIDDYEEYKGKGLKS